MNISITEPKARPDRTGAINRPRRNSIQKEHTNIISARDITNILKDFLPSDILNKKNDTPRKPIVHGQNIQFWGAAESNEWIASIIDTITKQMRIHRGSLSSTPRTRLIRFLSFPFFPINDFDNSTLQKYWTCMPKSSKVSLFSINLFVPDFSKQPAA